MTLLKLVIGGVAAVMLLAGCGSKTKVSAADSKAFSNASPELSQAWQTVLEASKTNDYFLAETVLYQMRRADLTPQQREAVNHQMAALNQRLSDALAKGDPAAKAANEELRKNPPNRQR